MKKIALFLTLLLLASCGTTTLENPTNDNPNSQET
jgi:hypothetical protein